MLFGWMVGRSHSGSCFIAGFDIQADELSGSVALAGLEYQNVVSILSDDT